jgi:hypothetical protein
MAHGMSSDLRQAPWQITRTQLVYTAPGLDLYADQAVRRADGQPAVQHRLVEPASVRVVAVDTEGNLALVWRWRAGLPGMELPAADLHPDTHTPYDAARRALRQDAGLAAAGWTELGEITVATATAAQTVHLFLAHQPYRAPRPTENGAAVALRLPYTIIVAGGAAGPVTDAASLTALLTAEQHRRRGDWHLPGTDPPPAPQTVTLRPAAPHPARRPARRRGQRPSPRPGRR